ncbi:CBASS cGAMP synthase [Sinorhizobium meliloti]|uniref:CBASS cGAMP synthase n=1 Tax=Rhizobium meliloti TaxID=382 RepID=UPI000FD9BA53|nr:hypothetical protein [Sinorhizobium meliloti]RVH17247.1 hypothetical protein CN215_32200 [Sinorhizobium meliloti]
MGLNAHRVFKSDTETPSYLSGLTLDENTESGLRAARDEIRQALKDGLSDWPVLIAKNELLEGVALDSDPTLRPKFRMQGSFSYRTCNRPAQEGQEIDLDDGVFLPVSFLDQDGTIHPAIASRGYFIAVERVLAPLCTKRSWDLVTDKSSCVRVQISKQAHIDLALYAIPDGDFETLIETAMARSLTQNRASVRKSIEDAIEFAEAQYVQLPEDHIMLAHRDEGWKKSDPRKLEDWFRQALKQHGEQLRRVSRYLKGWRDYQWASCRLASIALMSAAVTAYQEAKAKIPENRDDQALLMVVERLSTILQGAINNPVVEGARLDEGWTDEQRRQYSEKAQELESQLRSALQKSTNANEALAMLTRSFGDRIPRDASLISQDVHDDSGLAAPSVLTMGLLQEIGDTQEAREAVKLEGDGRYG